MEKKPNNYRANPSPRMRLSIDDIRDIKRLLKEGKTQEELMEIYKVSKSAISSAKNAPSWYPGCERRQRKV